MPHIHVLYGMFLFDFIGNVTKSHSWILYLLTLLAIFLKFVILFDMC
uniref:Uncharacterized protein n=1 Tax=Lotus japonicus TaxID=34305 RepID=I3SET2_LOTJA|nr:unknown [Lotus japonicus]